MKIDNYRATKLKELHLVTEDLPNNLEVLKERFIAVLYQEAPISEGLLERRVIKSVGMQKIGRIIQELLNQFLPTLNFKYTVYKGVKFYWKDEDDPKSCNLIRKSVEGENRRDAKDVPIEEAINAIKYVSNDSLSKDDTIRAAANLMGYTRLGSVVLPLFTDAYNKAN